MHTPGVTTQPPKDGTSRSRGAAYHVVLWGLATTGLCLAIAAAVSIGQETRQADLPSPQELSQSFRSIAQETFPGIVLIQTRGKAVEVAGPQGMDLEEFFRGNPGLEQFFKNNPRMFPGVPDGDSAPRRRPGPSGQGSGFIVDREGYIITNNHVIDNASSIVVRLHNGREYNAELIGTDSRSDVALIKIEAEDLQPIPLGDSNTTEVGDWVLAFGSPFGLEMTMTQGIISAKGRGPGINEREDYLQTDAAINPGNSGGPLVNTRGEVIGINTAISSRSGGYDGVGFSIPINMAKWVVDQLREEGRVRRAYIGVVIQPVTNDLANQLDIPVNRGAIVTQIQPDSPADKSGLETGDVILRLNGEAVDGTRQLQGIVERLNVGKSYPLQVFRNGNEKQLKITMAEMPDDLSLASMRGDTSREEDDEQSDDVSEYEEVGLSVQTLTSDLAEQFSFPKNVSGVVITSVDEDGVAAENGLREGELIERVGQKRIESTEDFAAAMKSVDLEKGVLMLVRRDNFTRFVVVKKN